MARRKKSEKKKEEELMTEFMTGCSSHPDRVAHALFAFTVGYLLGFDYWGLAVAIAFALFPDLDLAFYHREALHNIFMAFIVPAIFNLFIPGIFRYACIGYLSHIALDMLSPSGVGILWPFKRNRLYLLGVVKSGVPTLILSVIIFAGVMFLRNPFGMALPSFQFPSIQLPHF